MKNKKICLLIFIFLLYFSFLLKENNSIYNEQDDKDNRNISPILSASNSMAIEWSKIWGGSARDKGNGVAVDSSDNIYIVGSTESFMNRYDIVLMKYNSAGMQEWEKKWDEGYSNKGYGVAIDSKDNIYITGFTQRIDKGDDDIFFAKYNSLGIQQWKKTWGEGGNDHGYGIAIDSSDNILIVGYTESFGAGSNDMVLVKYNNAGIQEWNETWGGDSADHGHGIAVDSSDNIYIVGYTQGFGAEGDDIVLAKYNSSGEQEWIKTWGGSNGDIGYGIAIDSSDDIYIIGRTDSWGLRIGDLILVRYNSAGIQEWIKTWGGSHGADEGYGVAVDSEDNIYISGYTQSFDAEDTEDIDIVLAKYGIDSDGDDLSDLQENNIYLTDPNNPDTDGDGLLDGQEVNIYSTDPHNPDTDGDGLLDGEEVNIYSSDPNNSDTDGDLIPDGLDPHPSGVDIIIPLGIAGIIMIFIILSLSIYGIRKINISENSSIETSYNYDLKHVFKAPVKKNFIFSIIFGASLIVLFTLQNHVLLIISFVGGLIITLHFLFKYLFSNYPALYEEKRERFFLYLSVIMFLIMLGNAIWWLTSTYTEVITFSSENLFIFILSKNSLMLLPLYFIYIIFFILIYYCCKDLIFFFVKEDKTRIYLSLLVSMVVFILFNYGIGFIVVLMNLPLPTYIQGLFTGAMSDPIICLIGAITIPAVLFQSYFKSVGYLDTITGKKEDLQTKSKFTEKLSKIFIKIIKIIFVYLLFRNFIDLFLLLFNFYSPGGSSLLVLINRFIFGENIIILLISISIKIFLDFIITSRVIFSNYFGKSDKTFWEKFPIELKFIITSTVILGVGIIFTSEIWSTFQYLGLFSIEFFEPTWILILSNLVSIFGIFWFLKSMKYSLKKEKDYLIEQQGEAILFGN